jgi:hypothetical protein
MTRNPKTALAAIALILGSTGIAACTGSSGASATKAQSSNDSLAGTTYSEFNTAVPYPFAKTAPSDPLERKNLAKRLTTYNAAGDSNYVYVFTYSGQVEGYYVISGKVSSTGSEMTSTQTDVGCGSNSQVCTVDAVGDDGSYGPEEGGQAGVFFFTSSGVLVETDLPFLVSSSPVAVYASAPQLDAPAKS